MVRSFVVGLVLAILMATTSVDTRANPLGIIPSGDPCGYTCQIAAPAGQLSTFYVLAWMSPPGPMGVSRAAYRIIGIPAGWIAFAETPSDAWAVGNPFGDGVWLEFDECKQPNADNMVVLQTVRLFPTSSETLVRLLVHGPLPPLVPQATRPSLEWCDGMEAYSGSVAGAEFWINAGGIPCGWECIPGYPCPEPPECTVAVQERTWTNVRALYR